MTAFETKLMRAYQHLSDNDPKIAKLIIQYGSCSLQPHTNYYAELVSSIISQQLSVKAAATIYQRFLKIYGGTLPTPQQILDTDIETLRACGCSYSKANYIQDLAYKIVHNQLNLDALATSTNNQVIEKLTNVKGIGEWSAHMFMIFSLGRLDVLATGDLGIRKAVQHIYLLPDLPQPSQIIAIANQNNWQPYQSVVCWYLWKSLDNKPS